MRKNNTDHPSLFNRNFGLVCVAGFLLYATAYAVLLPLMRSGLASDLCFPFLIGMQLGGLFSAWLADKFRRKHVLGYPFMGILLVSIGYAYASTIWQYAALALLHGVCFGLASSAAVTLSIDVVHSGLRTQANTTYAFVSRLGMVVGGVAAWWLMPLNTYQWLMPVLFGGVGVLAAALMYVPFRAPIGLPVVSTDRYVLLRAVLPGLNVAVLAFACGMCVMSGATAWLFLPAVLSPWWVRMFVKLSHHCQRATGNVTYQFFTDAGLLIGVAYTQVCAEFPLWVPLAWLAFALVMYLCVTRIYYKKMRVR